MLVVSLGDRHVPKGTGVSSSILRAPMSCPKAIELNGETRSVTWRDSIVVSTHVKEERVKAKKRA